MAEVCAKSWFARGRMVVLSVGLACAAMMASAPAKAQDPHFVNINVPGAGGAYFAGTSVWDVNNLGEIAGWYGANDMIGSFVRYQDGRIVTYNAPEQGTADTSGTIALGLNDEGATAGVSFKAFGQFYYSFIRKPDGRFITFTPPGPCATVIDNGCFGWGAGAINDSGMVAGSYLDDNRVYRGFVRWPDGRMETFAAPGAGDTPGSYQGTMDGEPQGSHLNQFGAVTGYFEDSNDVYHGFVRWPNGSFSTIDAPGADHTPQSANGTFPLSINDLGVVTGNYVDVNDVSHGFVWRPNGEITTFDAPGGDMTPGSFNGTYPTTVNVFGEIVGKYEDAMAYGHGFVRYPDGRIWQFDPPNYTNDVQVMGIDAEGVIVGDAVNDFIGDFGTRNGFALLPH
jgi:hypothetical protein